MNVERLFALSASELQELLDHLTMLAAVDCLTDAERELRAAASALLARRLSELDAPPPGTADALRDAVREALRPRRGG